jgi:hypothetical protein
LNCSWNKEKLINSFTENKEKVLAAAHVTETLEKKPKSKKPKVRFRELPEQVIHYNII